MGNPWIDPKSQMSENGNFAEALGLINTQERNKVELA